jgi:lambda family phage portal protein
VAEALLNLSAAKAKAQMRATAAALVRAHAEALALNQSLDGQKRSFASSLWAGGQVSRLTSDWVTVPLSGDREARFDMLRLRARARDMARNSGYATRFLGLLEQNVVSHRGILLDVNITRGDSAHETMNDLVEADFKAWGHHESCSVDGRLDWVGVQRQLIRATAQDGEVLLRMVKGAKNPWGFALQLIDADMLDVAMNRFAEGTRNEIRMGVERDQWGRPLAYHVWKRHPNDYDFAVAENERERIPAEEIIHFALPRRIGETRSVTWFAPVLLNTKMLAGYMEAEVTAARIGAAKMGFITEKNPELGLGGIPQNPPNDQPLNFDVQPGVFEKLPPGMGVEPFASDHPNQGFDAFVGACMREIASGLGVSTVSASNDLRAVNYSSIRAGLLAERDFYRALQHWMIEFVHRRVFQEWLTMSVLTNRLPSGARAALAEGAVTWQPRGWGWVDPLKDAEAEVLLIGNGLQSRTASLAEDGREVEEVFLQLAAEKDAAAALGIQIEGSYLDPAPQQPKGASDQPAEAGGDTPRAAVLRAMAARDPNEAYTLTEFKKLQQQLNRLRAAAPKSGNGNGSNGNGNGRH